MTLQDEIVNEYQAVGHYVLDGECLGVPLVVSVKVGEDDDGVLAVFEECKAVCLKVGEGKGGDPNKIWVVIGHNKGGLFAFDEGERRGGVEGGEVLSEIAHFGVAVAVVVGDVFPHHLDFAIFAAVGSGEF